MPSWNVNFNTVVQVDNREVIRHVERIHALAAVIREIPIPPGVQRSIDALNILRAVRGTTGIEGTELTEDEVSQIMNTPPQKPVLPPSRSREEQEARNAEQLMYFVAEALTKQHDLPLSEQLICKIHEITTRNINYPNNIPGKYRSHSVSAGTYLPPQSADEVVRLMREFVDWFNNSTPKSWDSIVRAIIAHFYVISIHPFGDGNGRTARAVESYLLYQANVNARGFYSLSNYYYRYRNDYFQMLDRARFEANNDLTVFLLFALRGLVEELETVHKEILSEVKWISFRDFAREILSLHDKLATPAGDRMFHFLLGLGRTPVSLKGLRQGKHNLSYLYRYVTDRTLARDINFLKENNLIIVDGDEIEANLAVMTRFTPPMELQKKLPVDIGLEKHEAKPNSLG